VETGAFARPAKRSEASLSSDPALLNPKASQSEGIGK
jgi:hypothetical protein